MYAVQNFSLQEPANQEKISCFKEALKVGCMNQRLKRRTVPKNKHGAANQHTVSHSKGLVTCGSLTQSWLFIILFS